MIPLLLIVGFLAGAVVLSLIPNTSYRPELFVRTVEAFLDYAGITEATLAGVSIGGTIPLVLESKQNPRVKKVVSVNPYDYGKGMGIRRGNLLARLVFTLAKVPVLGETVMRLRNPFVERRIMEGGVSNPAALTPGFLSQLIVSGGPRGTLPRLFEPHSTRPPVGGRSPGLRENRGSGARGVWGSRLVAR